ncbi:PEPxxWA-CTERM sorting domain-containing protein [Phenylobacterium sp. LjRoot164]|uniref:PEPxxWA-CTERM sorting domain-containing protein n=1 Tax=unclassified Phenylobacterium TaxID=2640670 RepID=UPI003ECE79D5
MKKLIAGAIAAGTLMFGLPAAAAVTVADFRSESHLPDYSSSGGKLYQNTGAVLGAGDELDGGDFVSNPSGWGGGVVFVDWDAVTNILTLRSQDTWDFQTYSLAISNVLFSSAQTITGISLLSNNLTDSGVTPTLGFTGNSINIGYARPELFNFTGGTATFQVTLGDVGSAVPEPATWAMMIIGFGAVGSAVRSSRRRSAFMAA